MINTLVKNLPIFNHKTYIDKIRHTTQQRIFNLFIWKFFVGLIIYYIITEISSSHYIATYILNGVRFKFSFWLYIKMFVLTSCIDYYKIVIFQNYEETITKLEYFVKLFLDPGLNTIFLFVNSVLVMVLIKMIQMEGIRYKGKK